MLYRNETPAVQRQRAEMAREFVGFSLMEMAREALNAGGDQHARHVERT